MKRPLRTLAYLPDWFRRVAACRAYDAARGRTRLPGPLYVQVQTLDLCNQNCLMCPYGTTPGHGSGNRMDDRLYSHILDQLARAGTVTEFSPMLQNEPLLDPALGDRIAEARQRLGKRVRIVIVTNGTLLNQDRARELIARGTDVFEVSLDAATGPTYAAIHRSSAFDTVCRNIGDLLRHRGRAKVIVRYLRQTANEPETAQFRSNWESQGAETLVRPMQNRGGAVRRFDGIRGRWRRTVARRLFDASGEMLPACTHPFTVLNVLWSGRVPLCCADWGPEAVLGNLAAQPLAEVWNGEPVNRFRAALRKREVTSAPPCNCCSVIESAI